MANPYTDCPLHAKADSIRLVTVEPELKNGFVSCRFEAVTFSQRPQYDTLSYRWGDESIKNKVLVNDIEFQVTENLFQALQFFRQHRTGAPIWIDAISINQTDIAERTRQLRIMSHIYARANSVVVWLGAEYQLMKIDFESEHDEEAKAHLATDEYWNRVWILQEIGKARQVNLCLANQVVSWEKFIAWLEKGDSSHDMDAGPYKLHRLRENKYTGSCSLRQLLIDHEKALCKDPRDKIYGLVGLSTDGRGFPLDYSKSLLEVWSDTIRFMCEHKLLPEKDIDTIQFCKLVRRLLGGDQLPILSGVTELYNEEDDHIVYHRKEELRSLEAKSAWSTWMPCYGVIVALGPTATEMVDSLEVTDAWEAELQRNYPGDQGRAHAEQDGIMRKILDTPDSRLANVNSFQTRRVDVETDGGFYGFWAVNFGTKPEKTKDSYLHETTSQDEPRLAMVRTSYSQSSTTDCKLALVHPSTREGDLICRFSDEPMKRLVVRPVDEDDGKRTMTHPCGTAIMVKDVLAETTWDEEIHMDATRLQVALDPRTLYAMMFGDEK